MGHGLCILGRCSRRCSCISAYDSCLPVHGVPALSATNCRESESCEQQIADSQSPTKSRRRNIDRHCNRLDRLQGFQGSDPRRWQLEHTSVFECREGLLSASDGPLFLLICMLLGYPGPVFSLFPGDSTALQPDIRRSGSLQPEST